jgi:hypothetical protein
MVSRKGRNGREGNPQGGNGVFDEYCRWGDRTLLRVLCVLCVKHGSSFSNANEEILEEALQAS